MASADDFLSAFIAYTQATSLAGLVYTDQAPPGDAVTWPYVVIANYDDHDPGESLDDMTVTFTLLVHHSTHDNLKAFSKVVKASVDSLAVNPNSTRTVQLSWVGGKETGVVRNDSKTRQLRESKGGVRPWREAIDYVFWTTPA